MKTDINESIEIPQGVEVKIENGMVSTKGKKGEVSRKIIVPKVQLEVKDQKIVISSKNATKREKKLVGTFKSHIKNMIKGALDGYVYKLKICATHFPMNAAINNGEFVLQNFLGEKVPRTLKIKQGVSVKIEGQEITVESPDKELAGQTAGSIEQLCRITNRDKRIFQDGIYIISKAESNSENE